MNKDKAQMLIVAIAMVICIFWAAYIKDIGMVVLTSLAAVIAFYVAFFKMDAKEEIQN